MEHGPRMWIESYSRRLRANCLRSIDNRSHYFLMAEMQSIENAQRQDRRAEDVCILNAVKNLHIPRTILRPRRESRNSARVCERQHKAPSVSWGLGVTNDELAYASDRREMYRLPLATRAGPFVACPPAYAGGSMLSPSTTAFRTPFCTAALERNRGATNRPTASSESNNCARNP